MEKTNEVKLTQKQELILKALKSSIEDLPVSKLINDFRKTMTPFQIGAILSSLVEKDLLFIYGSKSHKYICVI